MKILHVVPTYLPATRYGGPMYSVHGLCRAQVARGHEVDVFTTNVDGPGVSDVPLSTPVDLDGVKVTYFPTATGRRLYRSPAMGVALAARVPEFSVLHLHSVFLWPTTAAARVARRHGVPYVLAPRGMLVADLIQRRSAVAKSAWIALFERRNMSGAAAVHVTADIEAQEIEKLGLRTRRMVVMPNGVELPPSHRGRRSGPTDLLPHQAQQAPVVLSLGRINWKKGLDRVVRAMAELPDAHLVIVGDDEDGHQAELELLARDSGVASRVHFLGPVHGAGKWELLAAADIFVLASHSENFGNAVLEAMACCVPVVITPGVGLAGVVEAEGAGLVVPGDPSHLAEAMGKLLSDRQMRERMGLAAARVAREQFAWPAVAAQSEQLYTEICGARAAANGRTAA